MSADSHPPEPAPDRVQPRPPPAETIALSLPGGGVLECMRVPAEAFESPPQSAVLAPATALAYVFAAPRRVGFWTLGFEHAVDQVFVARNGRVVQLLAARPPDDETLSGPATDVVLVLELAAGEAERLGLLPGALLAEPASTAAPVFDAASDPGFIAIVQSDRAGWFLACELRRRGYRIAHVHHTRHLEEVGEDEFDLELVYGEDLDEVMPGLIELGPSLVLAGSELGVNAADYLAEALGLPGNGTLRSVARRDKAGMVDALREAGIPVMRQLRTRSWKRVMRWMQRHALREVVIKPVRSAGTDRVTCARTPAEVRAAVRAIVGVNNRLGLHEVEVVAQERLFGPEIYLNTVSRAGRHAVTEIWLETKRAARGAGTSAPFAYDAFELLPGDDVLAGYLTAWLVRALDALGVAWGPGHTELILTGEGPRLIDFGARLDGVLLPSLNEECLGRSPVQITADAYVDPAAWHAWAARPYRLLQHATMVVIDNPCAGILRDDSGLRGLARLPTFHALRPRWGVGEHVPATRDAFSYHAIVTLRDPDRAAVQRDHAHIRALEAHGLLLDVTPPAGDPAPGGASAGTPRDPDDHAEALVQGFSDPRALDAWGRALEDFGWTTVRDEQSGIVARLRSELDGLMLWLPRQTSRVPLIAVERLRLATGANRVVIEVAPGTRIAPLSGGEVVVSGWDREREEALDALGLTPTMHAQSPAVIELARAVEADPDVVVRGLGTHDAALVESTFRALGMGESALWPAALGSRLAGVVPCALASIEVHGAITAAAIALVHGGLVHVPVASAARTADLRRLALALGAHFERPVVAPGTGVARQRGGVLRELPPALRWKRPAWAEHLTDIEGIQQAVGLPPAPTKQPQVAARFATREHPLATWGGALIAQALGRTPTWTRGAMLFREAPGEAAHGVVPHAARIDLAALDAIARRQRLLWVGWEPPPHGGEVLTVDGAVQALHWGDPWGDQALALHVAASLGLFPVRARWTHRKTHVLDISDCKPADIAPVPHIKASIAPIADLGSADWKRLDALDDACVAARSMFPHPRHAARGLGLGLGSAAICALAEDDLGLVAYAFCLLHDRVAWVLLSNAHPRADAAIATHLRGQLMLHARAAGCDLMDLHGAWDERFPDERPSWRESARVDAPLHPVYYPPTLARFTP